MRRLIITIATLLVLTGCGTAGGQGATSVGSSSAQNAQDKLFAAAVKGQRPTTARTTDPAPTTAPAPTRTPEPSPSSAPRTTQPAPPPPPPPPPDPIETDPAVAVSDACGTANDGVTLFPYDGGFYTDVDGNVLPATGVLMPVVGSIVIYAVVLPGYVFTDGSVAKEFSLTFTDVPC